MENETERYIVVSKTEEGPNIVTLTVTCADGSMPVFTAGQYINIYFPELDTPEGKAYSISSAPHEPAFSITVRGIGEFSNRLCALSTGDTISASLPYGFFCPESGESDIVMLAAGIGITPFRSMIRDIAHHNPKRRIYLFHSIRTSSDAIFQKELTDLKDKLSHLSVSYFVTRESKSSIPAAFGRRVVADDILSQAVDVENTEFLMCGSIPFTRDMWRALRHAGVSEDRMYTEAFFSH
ncbi:MAG: FAD-dependent oxidoreductase [Parcubacteria group bacterium]